MSIPGSYIVVRAARIRTECRHRPWAAVTICMVSERGWVIFSGWTGVGMNFGGKREGVPIFFRFTGLSLAPSTL